MKGRAYLIIGLLIGGICGWALGFLRLPLIEKNDSFWLGLLTGITLASAVLVARSSFVRTSVTTVSFSKRVWIGGIAVFLVSGGLLVSMFIDITNDVFLEQLMQKKTEHLQELALVNARQQANLGLVMESLFEQVQEEVNTQNGKVSPKTIGEIARISQAFEPYAYFNEDSLMSQKLSPERGQLLLFLISCKMDTASFQQAITQATFAGADLEGAKLAGLNLSGIDLMGANLRDAGLNDVDLRDSDLRGANLWGVQMKRADLIGVDMRRADVRWAELEEATLRYALLDGADFSDALMRKVDLYDAKFQYGDLSGAMLSEAFLSCADFELTKMNQIDCSFSDLSMANLKRVEVNEANFRGAELTGITVGEEDWIGKLPERKVAGDDKIRAKYQIANDSIVRYANSKYILIPISQEDIPEQN